MDLEQGFDVSNIIGVNSDDAKNKNFLETLKSCLLRLQGKVKSINTLF